jgi:hypothetical protein
MEWKDGKAAVKHPENAERAGHACLLARIMR